MIVNRSIEDIADYWQNELDTNLETGDAPVFVLGDSPALVGDLPGVIALQRCDEERRDAAAALAVGGGVSVAWLMALLHRRGDDAPARSPAIQVGYTGPDAATHAAALTVWDTRRSPFHPRPAGLPPAFQPHFAPRTQVGTHTAAALPFLAAHSAASITGDGWSAWASVVLAIVLILIAFIA